MILSAMTFKRIRCVALGLALSACSAVGFDSSPRQFSGVWLYEFEGSIFVEGATGIPRTRPAYEATDWLDYPIDDPRLLALIQETGYDDVRRCYTVQPFRVRFIGHRTHRPSGAGHMGLWRSDVTVQRTISLERLGPPFCYADEGKRN